MFALETKRDRCQYGSFVSHCRSSLAPAQFDKSMLGGRSCAAAKELWDHCLQLPEWMNHPAFRGACENNNGARESFQLSIFVSKVSGLFGDDKRRSWDKE